MKMRVVMSGPSGSLENDNVSDVEFDTAAGLENIFETGITCSHEWTQQCGIMIKPCSQELRHSQHHMSISYSWQKTSADEVGPSVGISLCTGKAKAGFAGESDTPYLSAVAASVLDKAHFVGITAVEHFLHGIIVIGTGKAWTKLLNNITFGSKNLRDCFLINLLFLYISILVFNKSEFSINLFSSIKFIVAPLNNTSNDSLKDNQN